MSNPSVCFLSFTVINGMNVHIEDNLGEAIHIHIGKLRISLSVEDYFVFAESVMKAVKKLFQVRGIELATLDTESLKEEWILYYDKIKSVQTDYAELESLYMKESYIRNRAIKRIIPLRESGYIKVLNGDRSDIRYYDEPGKLQPSRKEKMNFIIQKIKKDGYPWNDNLILVNQEGYIYDGIKRASCLYALYGGSRKIPVLRIDLPEEKSISERRKMAEDKVRAWEIKCASDKDMQRHKMRGAEKAELKQLIKCLNKSNIPFFVIKKEKKNAEGTLIAVATIIVEEGKLNIVKEQLNTMWQQELSPYEDYQFLYTASSPLYYLTSDGPVLIFDRLCCKNKFEKYILPLDRFVVKNSWKSLIWDVQGQYHCVEASIYILMILMDTLLESGSFDQADIEFMECHKEVLYRKDFEIMLEKEFFHYTPLLIGYLLAQQYELAISMYERFDEY